MLEMETQSLSHPLILKIQKQVSEVYKGEFSRWEPLLIGLFGSLHVLIEDLPGVGKTTLAKVLSKTLGLDFGRIQFTPDLIPGDVVGMTLWSQEKKEFFFRPGAVMHQFILADEINRASSRTQSALLEAMQENQVTLDGVTHRLPQPFLVVATQNPHSFQGTFPLPEAQLDRFGLVFTLGYPSPAAALEVLDLPWEILNDKNILSVSTAQEILDLRKEVQKISCQGSLKKWVIKIAELTRYDSRVSLGLSPRATQHWLQGSKACAFLRGRDFIIPEDILHVAPWILPHRLVLSGSARLQGHQSKDILEGIIKSLALPLQ